MSDEWVVTMPKLGETVTEGTVGNWLKQVGDTVAFDDPLFEVSTDKVDSEIPSPYDGVIVEILVGAGRDRAGRAPRSSGSAPPGSAAGPSGASRLPSAAHGVAAAGGPALGDPASPSMGGSEGMAGEDPELSACPTGVVHDITMPKLGETVTEGTIGSWLKQVGDTVAFDDPLFEVSTDKVDSEIPSPYDGVMLEILVARGGDRAGRHRAGPHRRARRGGRPRGAGGGARRRRRGRTPAAAAAAAAGAAAPPVDRNGRMLSPLVRRLVAEAGLDVDAITGSGAGGRIRREDVERAIAAGGAAQARPPAPAPTPPPRPRPGARAATAATPRPPAAAAAARPRAVAIRATRSSSCPACAWPWPAG